MFDNINYYTKNYYFIAIFTQTTTIYLYILRGFKKLAMTSKNVKNTPNLIR